jgi:hypothetical protein
VQNKKRHEQDQLTKGLTDEAMRLVDCNGLVVDGMNNDPPHIDNAGSRLALAEGFCELS